MSGPTAAAAARTMGKLIPKNCSLFLCDMQVKFRPSQQTRLLRPFYGPSMASPAILWPQFSPASNQGPTKGHV